jgi:hypothetical protein
MQHKFIGATEDTVSTYLVNCLYSSYSALYVLSSQIVAVYSTHSNTCTSKQTLLQKQPSQPATAGEPHLLRMPSGVPISSMRASFCLVSFTSGDTMTAMRPSVADSNTTSVHGSSQRGCSAAVVSSAAAGVSAGQV